MEGLSMDSILTSEEIEGLFTDDSTTETEVTPPKEGDDITTEVEPIDPESLFDDSPESVGSEEESQDKEKPESTNTETSSNKNFYSSIASALKDEGILPDLDDTTSIKTPEDFAEAIENQIKAKFDERQKRIDEALNVGVEPEAIKQYESTLNYLQSIKEETIKDESDQGEKLRKRLIFQDFVNRGYSEERAQREVTKSFNSGTDIDDAKEALTSNKQFFQEEYDSLIEGAKKEEITSANTRKEEAAQLKKSILEDEKVFGELLVDKPTRQKVYDSISKPIYKDPSTGELLTAVQKYERDNKVEFMKTVGLVFTLTDGFKSLDGLVKGKVKKEMNKGLRELEHTLNNTSRTSDGNLRFASSVGDDPESFIGKGWDIDI